MVAALLQLSASSLSPLRPNLTSPRSKLSMIANSTQNPHYHISPPSSSSSSRPLSQSVAAVVIGDGSPNPTNLYPLTVRRSESAIPIAGNYKLIDVAVSNCINSNINKIYVLTQFNSTSLNSHLVKAYSGVGLGRGGGFVEVVAAYQSLEHQGWFQGSADAIRRCMWVLEEYPVSEFLILPGHHLYRMDYRQLIEAHRNGNADVTIAAAPLRRDSSSGLGRLEVDSQNRVTAFHHVNSDGREPRVGRSREWNGKTRSGIGMLQSMGIYVINRDTLRKLVNERFPEAVDLGSEVIQGSISIGLKVQACEFNGYWEDMGSIGAFYRANLECINPSNTCYGFYDMEKPLYGMPRCLPPTTVSGAVITDSMIGDGCILNQCIIRRSVVGMRSKIGDGALIEDSVLVGSDIYHEYDKNIGVAEMENSNNYGNVAVPIGIGDDTVLRKVVVDKNARIGRNVKIINKDKVEEGNRESEGYVIRDGIVVILRGAIIPNHTIL